MIGVLIAASVAILPAQRGPRTTTVVECAAPLGSGTKTRRPFCDVLIGTRPADSVAMQIPAHAGAATLQFDLHNRFSVPAIAVPSPLTFARHEAVVAVIRPNGAVIGRAAVAREFRSITDLFDQIAGGGRTGGVKSVAPGAVEAVRLTIPAGVPTIGIVGLRLRVMTRASDETFDTPGRPVAIISNVRVDYRPAP